MHHLARSSISPSRLSIQRLTIRHLSTISTINPPQPSSTNHQNPSTSSILKWVSGIIAAASSSGAVYYFLSPTDDNNNTTKCVSLCNAVDDFVKKVKGKEGFSSFLPSQAPTFLFGEAYRRKIFFNYEKRIRTLSPPEKVFEYFASVQSPEGEVLMTPADLMRAVVPVFPPSDSHLVREGSLPGERQPGHLRCSPSELFMLFDVDNDGLISFKEYIFFVTLLSIPETSFYVAFKMFDTDNSGEIDRDEFKKVMAWMRGQNRQGASHRDGLRTGMKLGGSVENGGLVNYFFGEDGNKKLQLDKFVDFLRQLHDEMVRLEFSHYDYKSQGSISAKDFALSMVASADLKHINKLLDRVDELDNDPGLKSMHISEEEFHTFAELRKKLEPFAVALFAFGKVTGLLTKADFQRAASQVCGVSLTDNVIDVVFHVFDANSDGNLSADEFLRVMQKRGRDIAQPVYSGIPGLLACCFSSSGSLPRPLA